MSKEELMVTNETGKLKKVVIHKPDKGIEVVTPGKALEFLYDDIVHLPRMLNEHNLFTRILSIFIGKKNVVDTENLLRDILKNAKVKDQLLKEVCKLEGCDKETLIKLKSLPVNALAFTLFTGIFKKEKRSIFPPLPNYVFTRDIGVVINGHIVVCQASKKARTRETILTRCIIYNHPLFTSAFGKDKIIDLTKEGEEITLEGGDVMMVDDKHVLIGNSERTSVEAVEFLRDKLFEKGVIENVIKVTIPNERTCMHIDTLFTQISKDEYVVFAPYVTDGSRVSVVQYTKDGRTIEHQNLLSFLETVNPDFDFIYCGNGEYPYDEREQWTDGCNLVTIKDGVAIAYQRNYKTSQALKRRGYNIVDAKTLIRAHQRKILEKKKVTKTIITIPSTELSRARGGPHCMTFPISRG